MRVLGMSEEARAERGTRTKRKPDGGSKRIVDVFPRDFPELNTWKKQMREKAGYGDAQSGAFQGTSSCTGKLGQTDTKKKRKRGPGLLAAGRGKQADAAPCEGNQEDHPCKFDQIRDQKWEKTDSERLEEADFLSHDPV